MALPLMKVQFSQIFLSLVLYALHLISPLCLFSWSSFLHEMHPILTPPHRITPLRWSSSSVFWGKAFWIPQLLVSSFSHCLVLMGIFVLSVLSYVYLNEWDKWEFLSIYYVSSTVLNDKDTNTKLRILLSRSSHCNGMIIDIVITIPVLLKGFIFW